MQRIEPDDRLQITASFGVASVDPETTPNELRMEDLVSAADRCLIQAKESGRNRTVGTRL